MMNNNLDEINYLENTISKFKVLINELNIKISVLPKMYSNNVYMMDKLFKQYSHKLNIVEKTKDKPYFARIDFIANSDNKIEKCYIGKVGVSDEDNEIITVDWRAPIASLYYDGNVGDVSYQAPDGLILGKLLLKRQYNIEKCCLIDFQDVDTVSNDEILKPYLGVNSHQRLKNIVSTIQKEQNEIIRSSINNNLIIQGVAGSGKTTVALHRIAYLVYNNLDNINPSQYLVVGPNKFFINYISGVLPDLDVDSVLQLTYEELLTEVLKEKITLISDETKLILSINNPEKLKFEKFKGSLKFKDIIDIFLEEFEKELLPCVDFNINGFTIMKYEEINEIYKEVNASSVIKYDILAKKVERIVFLIQKYIDDNYEVLLLKASKYFLNNVNDIDKNRIYLEEVKKELKNKCTKSLKKYFLGTKPKVLNIYKTFLTKMMNNKELIIYNKEINECIKLLNKRCIESDDLAVMLYFYYRIYGNEMYKNIRHVVVDEAQDLGEFNFFVLKEMMPNATFSIFGDLAQAIYQYRGIDNWEDITSNIFCKNTVMMNLSKSYRTTIEIMNEANKIIKYINLEEAMPVIRHGKEVEYLKIGEQYINDIVNIIDNSLSKNYASIAIITKDCYESDSIYNFLSSRYNNVKKINSNSDIYENGICIITSYLSKGLEFDTVIISDASNKKYDSNKKIDNKLLYVSMTRAMHELYVFYSDSLNSALKSDICYEKNISE